MWQALQWALEYKKDVVSTFMGEYGQVSRQLRKMLWQGKFMLLLDS